MLAELRTLAAGPLELILRREENRLHLDRLAFQGISWLHPSHASGLFAVEVDGKRVDTTQLTLQRWQETVVADGVRLVTLDFVGSGVGIEQHIKLYTEASLVEFWQVIHNRSGAPVQIGRMDSLALSLPDEPLELLYFSGGWGREFEPQRAHLPDKVILESRTGRSSKGHHPWFALFRGDTQVLSAAVAWSGNWVFRFEPQDGGVALSGGLHDWAFHKELAPDASVESAPVVVALGASLNAVSQQYARAGRKHWYPRNSFSARVPVEWNHWWPYEDAEIDAGVFAANVVKAKQMGFEVCTLDAGWFGPSDAGTFWEHFRGDWHLVNQDRFPQGLRPVGDHVHAHGMKFGIWCEIEGLGSDAQVAHDHPDFVAERDGQRLGYICFGNPRAQEWAYATLSRLITAYGADWIKIDFNLDPGAGCNRTDHGHGPGDGLYEHYIGYYHTLERIRRDFPEVVLENCSSGGLRIDLGMMRRTYMTFLSDPDWPVHDLQIFWGASTMLAPDVLLHWTFSHWRNLNPPPYQNFDPHDPSLTRKQWDYYSRISMLGLYGLSQKLPDLPDWLAQRAIENNAIYKDHVRRFVQEADLYRLTDQPLRNGEGERWAAFQYALPDRSEHLLFVFRLPGAEQARSIRLQELEPSRMYTVAGLEGEWHQRLSGRAIMEEGIHFSTLDEEDSALLHIR
ncbi:MAG: alpha-galactosidase [Caldilineaceae bacterium]|nr:alpha-galactosidase [Caldilineaceae bacterium]